MRSKLYIIKKLIVLTLLLAGVASALQAQTKKKQATDILNRVAENIEKNMPMKAVFSTEIYENNKLSFRDRGNILVDRNMFTLSTSTSKIWFDGKTQHTYIIDNDEVTIGEPTLEEINSINPYTLINLHKHGYKISFTGLFSADKNIDLIELTDSTSKKEIRTIQIYVDKNSSMPVKIVAVQRSEKVKTVIDINSYESKVKTSKEDFTFNKEDYKTAEIIDIR